MSNDHLSVPDEAAITDYLGDVALHLDGPRRIRAAILDELRDGLSTAVLGRHAQGTEQAVAATLREFGPPEVVAAAFAGELAVARARRTVVSFLATGPLVGLPWLVAVAPPIAAGGVAAVWRTVPAGPAVAVAVVIGALVLVATGRLGHRFAFPEPHAGYGALVVITAAAVGDVVMLAHSALTPGFPISAVGGLAVAASAARLGCGVIAAVLCIRLCTRSSSSGS